MSIEIQDKRDALYVWAEALYDHQDVRIRSMNRVRSLIRRKLEGLGYRAKEERKSGEEQEEVWSDDEIFELLENAEEENKLTNEDVQFLKANFKLAQRETVIEKEYEKKLAILIKEEKVWAEWLRCVKGIGVRNAARLLKWFGYCERFDTVSKLWAYSGLSVYEGHAERPKKGEQLSYNLKIKTAMLGVLGDSLVKAAAGYKKHGYDSYKSRIAERGCCDRPHAKHKGKMCRDFPGHAHRMAIRRMVKLFLSHYWQMTRELLGLPTRSSYPHREDNFQMKPFYDRKPDEVI